jgi:hypothetical protein
VHDTLDYIDYHVYPPNRNYIVGKALVIDSIAHANGKGVIIGEAWCNKETDSEYTNLPLLQSTQLNEQRDVFTYFEPVDTQFVRAMVNLSQQGRIDIVSFFYSNVMFGQIGYSPAFDTIPLKKQINIGQSNEFGNMFNGNIGPVGLFTQAAIAHVCDNPCDTVHGLSVQPVYGNTTATPVVISWNAVTNSLGYQYTIDGSPLVPSGPGTYSAGTVDTITSLPPGSSFYLHVRDSCANGNSAWVTIPFQTPYLNVPAIHNNEAFGLMVYPNPATDIITLKKDGPETGYLQITDLQGRALQNVAFSGTMITINTKGLTQGIYLIHYTDNMHTKAIMFSKQ